MPVTMCQHPQALTLKRSASNMTIYYHNHHIIPRHMNGTDDPSNLIKVNVAMHAFLHKLLWEEHSNQYDYIAWKCLSGQITNEEANRLANVHYHIGRDPWNKGKKGVQQSTKKGQPRSDEEKKKISVGTKSAMVNGNRGGRKKGSVPWNKGKNGVQQSTRKGTKQSPCSDETKKKISEGVKKSNDKKKGEQ